MKTAISVPDELFVRGDSVARRLGLTRSELYSRALAAFLGPAGGAEITATLDRVYADDPGGLDGELRRLQARAVDRSSAEW